MPADGAEKKGCFRTGEWEAVLRVNARQNRKVRVDSSEVHAISLAERSAQSPVKQEELEQGANPSPPTPQHMCAV